MTSAASAPKFAFAAIVLFVAGMTMAMALNPPIAFIGPPPATVIITAMAFMLFHLSLLPVVAAFDAPAWAKGSGYAWIAVDNVIVFMGYFGVTLAVLDR